MEKVIPFEVASLYRYHCDDVYKYLQTLSKINPQSEEEDDYLSNVKVEEDCSLYFNDRLLWICESRSQEPCLKKIKNIENCLEKFEVTTKEFINFLFDKDFSDNLMEIFIAGEYIYDYFDDQFLYGSQLNLSREYEKIIENQDIQILDVKLQPLSISSSVTLCNDNVVEFSNKNNTAENAQVIRNLTNYVMNYLKTKRKGDGKK